MTVGVFADDEALIRVWTATGEIPANQSSRQTAARLLAHLFAELEHWQDLAGELSDQLDAGDAA